MTEPFWVNIDKCWSDFSYLVQDKAGFALLAEDLFGVDLFSDAEGNIEIRPDGTGGFYVEKWKKTQGSYEQDDQVRPPYSYQPSEAFHFSARGFVERYEDCHLRVEDYGADGCHFECRGDLAEVVIDQRAASLAEQISLISAALFDAVSNDTAVQYMRERLNLQCGINFSRLNLE